MSGRAAPNPYEGCETYAEHGACVCSTGLPANCTAVNNHNDNHRKELPT